MELSEEIALKLLQINAIQLSLQKPFTWASGLRSPIYCDNRLILSYPKLRNDIVRAFTRSAEAFGDFDCVAGVATAGIAHGVLVAQALNKPFIYVRATQKAHGRKNQIEGLVVPGQSVLVIEDLISTGGSCLAAVEALRASGCNVIGVLAIFQYNFKEAVQCFDDHNCIFSTLSDYETLIGIAEKEGHVNDDEAASLSDWHTDPKNWTPKETLEL